MATVDIDMTLPIREIAEPVILTMSIEEVRKVIHSGLLPSEAFDELQDFIEEHDAHGH
jgi:hypothetical protein